MSKARIYIHWQHKAASLLMAALLLSGAVQAQLSLKRQKYDSIAARYKGEHAVYTDVIRKVVIKEEDGEMTATSRTLMEKLFISEKSLSKYNSEPVNVSHTFVYGGEPNYTNVLDATIYIPENNDYRVKKNTNANGRATTAYTGLTKGSITSTSFVEGHDDLHILPPFVFSSDIPVLNAVFELAAPRNVKMNFLLKGNDTSYIRRTVTEKDGMIIYRFTATNVPAEKNYEGVPTPLYYMPHVFPIVVSFRLTGAKKDSVIGGSENANHKYEYAYVKGRNLEDDSFINKKTIELTKYAYSDRDKAQRILDWVQKNFHYLALYTEKMDGNVPHQADSVCKRMYGDCKDMSSVILTMCRKAGMSAYFAIIGTSSKPYMLDEMQSEYVYDHMICAVKIDGAWVFLDGTTHVQPYGANRPDIQGKEAYIMLDDTHHEVVKIPEAPASVTQISSNTIMSVSYGGNVSGTISRNYTGYAAWDMGENLNYLNRKDEKDEYIRKKMQSGNDKFLIQNYNINRNEQGQKDISVNANYTLGNYAVQVKNDYYVNMNVNDEFADLRVNEENRNVPLYLDYKNKVNETVTLNIPKGYRVVSLPKPAKGGVDGLWSYTISYKTDKKAHAVILTKEYELNTMKINPSQFEAHNNQVDQLKKQYKETVVLTK